jgi:hypothetical protein
MIVFALRNPPGSTIVVEELIKKLRYYDWDKMYVCADNTSANPTEHGWVEQTIAWAYQLDLPSDSDSESCLITLSRNGRTIQAFSFRSPLSVDTGKYTVYPRGEAVIKVGAKNGNFISFRKASELKAGE